MLQSHTQPGHMDLALEVLKAARAEHDSLKGTATRATPSNSRGAAATTSQPVIALSTHCAVSRYNALRAVVYAQSFVDPIRGQTALGFTLHEGSEDTLSLLLWRLQRVRLSPAWQACYEAIHITCTNYLAWAFLRHPAWHTPDIHACLFPVQLPVFGLGIATALNSSVLPGSCVWVSDSSDQTRIAATAQVRRVLQ